MSVISYIQIFANYACSVLLFFLPSFISYKRFALILAITTACIQLIQIMRDGFKVSITYFVSFIIFAYVVVSYRFFTPLFYNSEMPTRFSGEYLALVGQTFPYSLSAILVSQNAHIQKSIKRDAIVVSSVFSIISFLCTINPSSSTTGGFALTDNDLNYQSLSYMASYGSALAEYYLISNEGVRSRDKTIKIFSIFLVILNLFTILLAGGRGGMVSYIVFLLLTIYLYMNHKGLTTQNILKYMILFLLIPIVVCLVVFSVSNTTISTSGFRRIVGLFSGTEDSGRVILLLEAIDSFKRKPIFGHGFGSVFYEIGIYSHNIFTDILLETGFTGFLFFIIAIWYVFRNLFLFIKEDYTESIWLYILLTGLIMCLFSGYYIAIFSIWWIVFFTIGKVSYTKRNQAKRETNG